MRGKTFIVPGLCAALLGLAATAPPALARSASSTTHDAASASSLTTACVDNEGPDGGTDVNSQNYPDFPQADDAAAADFMVTSKKCVISAVIVQGRFYNGSGGDSFRLVVYKNDPSTRKPGRVVAEQDDLAYTYDPDKSQVGMEPSAITLHKGHYWISVVANMDLGFGEWNWSTSETRTGRPDMWESPNAGDRCQTWGTLRHCLDVQPADLIVTAGS